MRIAIDGRGAVLYRGTGIGTYTAQLIDHLKDGHGYHRYSIYERVESAREKSATAGWEYRWVPATVAREPEDRWINEDLASDPPDVYHMPQNGIGFPSNLGKPIVVTVHDLIPYILPQTCTSGYLQRFLDVMPMVVREAAFLIAVSRQTRQDLIDILGVSSDRITVVYEAAEAIYHPMAADEAQATANQWGINAPYLICTGGVGPRKNLSALVHAFCRLQEKAMNLVITGPNGVPMQGLRNLVQRLQLQDRVFFPGVVPLTDLPALVNGAVALVYPSIYEGYGLPVVEAMACGIPVLASRCSSIPEVGGDAILYCDPYSMESIHEGMERLIGTEDLRRRLSQAGLIQAARFSWRQAAVQTELVYEAVGAP